MINSKLENYAGFEKNSKNYFQYLLKPLLIYAIVLGLNNSYAQAQKVSFVEELVCGYFGDKPNTEENVFRAKKNTQILKRDNFMFSAKVRLAYFLGGSKGASRKIKKAVSRSSFQGEERRYALKKNRYIRIRGRKLHRQYK